MISPLAKIKLVLPKQDKIKTLKLLQSLGCTEIIQISQKNKILKKKILEQKIEALNLKLKEIDFALELLKNYQDKKQDSFWEKLAPQKPELTLKQIEQEYKKIQLDKIVSNCQKAEEMINKIQSEMSLVQEKRSDLEPWKKLSSLPQETKFTATIIGRALLNNYLELFSVLEKEIKEVAFQKIYQDLKYVYLSLTFRKEHQEKIQAVLNNYKFEVKEWEEKIQSPALYAQNLKQKAKKLKLNLKKQTSLLRRLSKKIDGLELAYDWVSSQKERLEAQKNCSATKYFTIVNFWVESKKLKFLEKKLKKNLGSRLFFQEEPIQPQDKPPVIIKNKKVVSPFETVTGIYGLPKFRELDPTPFLAPFFILFFAICLSDAGYGLIMALLSFSAIKIMKIPRQNQKFFRLMIYAGLITFLVGAVFGGWFGIDLASLPPMPLKNILLKIRLINPMTDTLLFMGLTFVLGFIQVWFAQAVKLYHSIKINSKEDIVDALLWILFLGALLFLGIAEVSAPSLKTLALYVFLACLIGLIMLTNKKINLFVRPFIGLIIVLQTLIGFMSDILSYSRLMALGLATGIIGFIINIIAGIFRDMIPYLGWIIWMMILVGGHLFNIGINALGGFIHSARLQFVEFFPKFMEGGGKKFQPFAYNVKFINIKGQ